MTTLGSEERAPDTLLYICTKFAYIQQADLSSIQNSRALGPPTSVLLWCHQAIIVKNNEALRETLYSFYRRIACRNAQHTLLPVHILVPKAAGVYSKFGYSLKGNIHITVLARPGNFVLSVNEKGML